MNITRRSVTILTVLLSTSLVAADKSGTLGRDTELRKAPSRTADLITTLAAQNKVHILRRQGGWYEIKSGEQTGWVRLLTVKLNRNDRLAKPDNGDEGIGKLLGGLATGRERSDEVTAATAVRGIDEEELKNAEPDQEALILLDKYVADTAAGQAAADAVGLRKRNIEYIAVKESKNPQSTREPDNTDDNKSQED